MIAMQIMCKTYLDAGGVGRGEKEQGKINFSLHAATCNNRQIPARCALFENIENKILVELMCTFYAYDGQRGTRREGEREREGRTRDSVLGEEAAGGAPKLHVRHIDVFVYVNRKCCAAGIVQKTNTHTQLEFVCVCVCKRDRQCMTGGSRGLYIAYTPRLLAW